MPHPCSLLSWVLGFLGAANRCLARCVTPSNSFSGSPLGWFMMYRRAARSISSKPRARCGTGTVHHQSRGTARVRCSTWDGHMSDRAPLCPSAFWRRQRECAGEGCTDSPSCSHSSNDHDVLEQHPTRLRCIPCFFCLCRTSKTWVSRY